MTAVDEVNIAETGRTSGNYNWSLPDRVALLTVAATDAATNTSIELQEECIVDTTSTVGTVEAGQTVGKR